MTRRQASLILIACSIICTATHTGCRNDDQPPPVDTDSSTSNMMSGPQVDLVPIVGANPENPTISPNCGFERCSPRMEEPQDHLPGSGECVERHFLTGENDTRTQVDEITAALGSGGRLESVEADRGRSRYTITDSKLTAFERPSDGDPGTRVSGQATYSGAKITSAELSRNGMLVGETEWTYDEDGRVYTKRVKQRESSTADWERTAYVYAYQDNNSREYWLDGDVNGELSDPDQLLSITTYDDFGKLLSIQNEQGDFTETFEYDESDRPLRMLLEPSGGDTVMLYEVGYNEDSTLKEVYIDPNPAGTANETPSVRGLILRDEETNQPIKLEIYDDTSAVEPVFEIEFEGRACDRPIGSWLRTTREGYTSAHANSTPTPAE